MVHSATHVARFENGFVAGEGEEAGVRICLFASTAGPGERGVSSAEEALAAFHKGYCRALLVTLRVEVRHLPPIG